MVWAASLHIEGVEMNYKRLILVVVGAAATCIGASAGRAAIVVGGGDVVDGVYVYNIGYNNASQ